MKKFNIKLGFATLEFMCAFFSVSYCYAQNNSFPLTLESAMNMSEEHAFSAKITARNEDIAAGNESESFRQFFPNVTASGNYLTYDTHVNKAVGTPLGATYGVPPVTVSTASLVLTQPLVGLVPMYLNLQAASAKLEAATRNTKQSKEEARFLGASSFINAVKAIQLLNVAQSSVEVAKTQLHDGVAQYNAGKLTNADVLKFKLNLENANTSFIQAQTIARITLVTLAEVVGIPNSAYISLPKNYSSIWATKQKTLSNLEEAIQFSLQNRNELLAAKSSLEAANYSKYSTESSYLPTVNFVANYTRNLQASDIRNPTTGVLAYSKSDVQDTLYTGITFNWNLLDWGVRQAQISSAVAGESMAQTQVEQEESQIKIEVTSNYLNLQEAYQNLDSAKVSVDYAKDVFLQMEAQFNNGQATTTDVLSAATDRSTALANFANATGDLDIAWLNFKKSVGKPLTTLN